MITRLKSYFTAIYETHPFLEQRLSVTLFYFSISIGILLAFIMFALILFAPHLMVTAIPVTITVLTFIIIALFILRTGRFNLAATLVTSIIILALIGGEYGRMMTAPHLVFTTNIYFLIASLVVASLFCTIRYVITASIIIVINNGIIFFLIKDKLDPLLAASSKIGLIYSTLAIGITVVISHLIFTIFKSALEKIQSESNRNEEQYLLVERLLRSAQNTSNQLSALSGELSRAADTFLNTSQNQAASTEEITSAAEEISSGMDLMKEGATDQYANLNELIAILQNLSASITEAGRIAGDALALTTNTSADAKDGETALNNMNESLSSIIESSRDIADTITIITDISDRINLLALNASIEAARAGDAGRGFAVVADEVSKLADQTATSIKDIDTLIRASNDEIGRGITDAREVIGKITTIIESINAIAGMMNSISDYIQKQVQINEQVNAQIQGVQSKSNEIKISIEEQQRAFSEILQSISEINDSNQLTIAESENIASGAKQISNLADDLTSTINTSGNES